MKKPIWRSALLGVFAGAIFLCASVVDADQPTTLRVKPKKCIALQKGQVCYQTVKFHWITPNEGDYCLFQEGTEAPLVCWKNKGIPPFTYEFSSSETRTYFIKSQQTQKILGQTQITVAWVYKMGNKPRSGWRLF